MAAGSSDTVFADPAFRLVRSQTVDTKLAVGRTQAQLKGQLQLIIRGTKRGLEQGTVEVEELTFAAFDVNQRLLTNRVPRNKANSVVSFRMQGKGTKFRYDANTRSIGGSINGLVHYAQLTELFPPQMPRGNDDFDLKSQPATMNLNLKLDTPLTGDQSNRVEDIPASVSMTMRAAGMREQEINDFNLSVTGKFAVQKYWIVANFEIVRRLCLQPVRIRASAGEASPTGAGLEFGLPGATSEWRKGDVIFDVRPFKEIVSPTLKILSESEAGALLSTVNDDDCIEIFFVQSLEPESLWGGGATFGTGHATAQIITSDGMVPAGIDLRHLAHELGHVMNLKHPGYGTATSPEGSTGTIMCPSGWLHDNPDANSTDNRNNIGNPLFRLSITTRGSATDCQNSADCG
ncbi:hypothetical protein EBZ80_23415, partial [bacterium]|nr:hypothetical protein [bacterium]